MPARVTILCGPARSGKTERLLARYREALAERPPGSTLWLAPTWRAAAEVRDRLLDGTLAGCFAPGVMTFAKFAQAVLHAARLPIRPVGRLMKRELVRQIIGQQSARGRLRHFQSIATNGRPDRSGLRVHQRVEAAGNLARAFSLRLCRPRRGRQRRGIVRDLRPLSASRSASTACSTRKGRSGRHATCWRGERAERRRRGQGDKETRRQGDQRQR